MPQLNPAPWLMIMLTVWFITLLMMKPKLLKHQMANQPTTKPLSTQPPCWSWLWC